MLFAPIIDNVCSGVRHKHCLGLHCSGRGSIVNHYVREWRRMCWASAPWPIRWQVGLQVVPARPCLVRALRVGTIIVLETAKTRSFDGGLDDVEQVDACSGITCHDTRRKQGCYWKRKQRYGIRKQRARIFTYEQQHAQMKQRAPDLPRFAVPSGC